MDHRSETYSRDVCGRVAGRLPTGPREQDSGIASLISALPYHGQHEQKARLILLL